ncbi:MAG TPA: glycosyltransferase [Caldithrix abyssi]|uniref:Glycosyltransferase n=1 Tax=Caldithrix abyssi TaxID=187145 RepID=A0A7V4WUG1_CALAY|nr:glycosyltransferase [Caldithrix abyssi]
MPKKILLIPDEPNWALDKNAKDLVKYNKSKLRLDICYYDDFRTDADRYYREYDLLFPMYMGIFFDFLKRRYPVDTAVTGIRSYHRWDKRKTLPPGYNTHPSFKIVHKLKKALLVNTHCKKLWYIFARYFPVIHTKYTCDLQMFYPETTKKKSDKLIIGWTGSLTNHPGKRGFHEFIKPACEAVDGVELKVQSKEDGVITDDNQMRAFYNSLDLYIIASRSEGTPRPAIEAAACGVPVISTDVGIIPELMEDGENGFIVRRTLEAFVEKLQWIADNRDRLPEMGKKLRQKMEREFNWEHLIYQWTDFMEYALEIKRLKKEGYLK